MQIHELTALARQMKASDIHISEGLPLMFRIDGRLVNAPVQMSADETRSLILGLMDEAHREAVTTERIDADFALVAPDGTRSRVNVFYQQNKAAATLRLLNNSIPTLAELSMPPVLTKLADEPRGFDPRHRPHRQRQIHDAGRYDRPHQRDAQRPHHHDRESHRVCLSGQAGAHPPARSRAGRVQLCRRPAQRSA